MITIAYLFESRLDKYGLPNKSQKKPLILTDKIKLRRNSPPINTKREIIDDLADFYYTLDLKSKKSP